MSATDVVTGRSTRRRADRRLAGPPRRDHQGPGHVRLLVGPADRRRRCGAPRCARRTRTPASSRSTRRRRGAIPGVEAVHHRRRRARQADLRPDRRRPAGVRRRRRALRRRAGRRGGRRPPRDVPAGARRDRRRRTRCSTRCSTPRRRSTASHPPIHPDGNVLRHQRIVRGDRRRHRRRRRRGHLRDRHAGPGVPRPRGGGRRARPRRRAASSCTSPRSGCTRTASRSPPASACPRTQVRLDARRRRRRLRRPRGHQPAGPHLPAGPAPRAPGAHGLQPGARASSATSTATRRRSGCATTPPRDGEIVKIEARFVLDGGRLRLDVVGRAAQRHHPRPGPVPLPERRRRRLRRAHQPPAVRGDARLRRRPGVLRPREPDGPARRGVRARPGRGPAAQRHGHRRPADHRAGRRERGARSPAASARRRRCRCRTTPIGVAPDVAGVVDPMRLPGGAGLTADVGHVRRGVGWGVAIKNLMYSEGFDDYSTARCRLADGVATLKFATVRGRARASSRSPSRSPAPCSASTTWCSSRSTPRSARPARRRRRARRG